MKLAIATVTVKPTDWAQALKIANDKGLSRAAWLRFILSEAIKADTKAIKLEALELKSAK